MGLDTSELPNPNNVSILDVIRDRPAMYIGDNSFAGLWYFLNGYEMGKPWTRDGARPELPPRFADWVAYRLHQTSNRGGFWHVLIQSRVRDEASAFSRFYELRESFYTRKAIVVATILDDRREHRVYAIRTNGEFEEQIEMLPRSLQIVVYSDDPGFFLEADEVEHFFFKGWFFCALDDCPFPVLDRFKVVEPQIWDRLLKENKRYKRNLTRRRARRKETRGSTMQQSNS